MHCRVSGFSSNNGLLQDAYMLVLVCVIGALIELQPFQSSVTSSDADPKLASKFVVVSSMLAQYNGLVQDS